MPTPKQTHKLTEEQLIEAFRASGGNFAQTAQYITQHFNISYTPQAVQSRIESHPELTAELFSIIGNHSSTKLMVFANDETNDVRLRARIYHQMMYHAYRMERLKSLVVKKKNEPRGVFQLGNYTLEFPGPGDKKLTPEEETKKRQEILDAIKRNA